MKKDAPTLADGIIREWLKPTYRKIVNDNWLLRNLSEARKFVLDKGMSAMMADLAYASQLTTKNGKAAQILLDSLRRQSHLPHPITWIEFDSVAKMTRANSEYGARIDMEAGFPAQGGWLCVQHPQLQTAYLALECVSHSWTGEEEKEYRPQPSIVAHTWRTDDGPPPWSNADIADYIKRMSRVTYPGTNKLSYIDNPEGIMTGIMQYRSESVKLIKAPHLTMEFVNRYMKGNTLFNPLKELAGDLRYLWALLATINDLPVSVVDVVGSKGFVARGRYRKFVDHKIIHLHIPEKRYKKVACQAVAITRRRAHPVRGHFRIDWHKPLSRMCDHRFGEASDRGHVTCNICHGRKLLIPPHVRGDASLGIVTHDYVVEHS